MSTDILDELFEAVVAACDSLFAKRQLITQKSVMDIVALRGKWSTDSLQKALPNYINNWRLQNLGDSTKEEDNIMNQQMERYQSERETIINDLKSMLGKMGKDDA